MFYHLLFSYNNTYYISRSDFSTGLQTSLFTNLPTWSCYFMVSAQSKWNLIFPKACFRISLPHLSKWKCHHIFHAKNFIFHSFLSSTTANSSASSINKNSKYILNLSIYPHLHCHHYRLRPPWLLQKPPNLSPMCALLTSIIYLRHNYNDVPKCSIDHACLSLSLYFKNNLNSTMVLEALHDLSYGHGSNLHSCTLHFSSAQISSQTCQVFPS